MAWVLQNGHGSMGLEMVHWKFCELKMSSLRPEEAAYIAGFLDGEGHIGIVRRNYGKAHAYMRPIVQVGQVNRLPLDWICNRIGQHSGMERRANKHPHRDFYNLRLHAGTARWLLPQILPYLVLKRRQAEVVLEFLAMSSVSKNGRSMSAEEKDL